MVVAMVSVFAVIPLVGWDAAVVTIPIVNGGIVATNLMVDAALAKGATMAAALGTLAYGVQKFVGTIPASKMGLAEANMVVEELRRKKAADPSYSWYAERDAELHKDGAAAKVPFWKKHEKIWTTYVCLFVVYVANEVGVLLAGLTNNFITSSIWCLILGCLCAEIGIVPPKILDRAKSSGFFMVLVYVSIIASLATITFADLMSEHGPAHHLRRSAGWYLCVSVHPARLEDRRLQEPGCGYCHGPAAGLPGYLPDHPGDRPHRGQDRGGSGCITARIEPAYVLAGFATVTSFSIIIAGFFQNLL